MQKTVQEVCDEIAEHAAGANHETRVLENPKEYRFVRQGDVYLWVLPAATDEARQELVRRIRSYAQTHSFCRSWEDFSLGSIGEQTRDRQLAPGSTRGSRHEIASGDMEVVEIRRPSDNAHPLEGPVVIANGRFRLDHPDHADADMAPGVYQVVYQRDLAFEEAKRIVD